MLGMPAERPAADFTIDQDWPAYAPEEHQRWQTLFQRQAAQLPGRAAEEFLAGLDVLGMVGEGIPDFRRLNEVLWRRTGWKVVNQMVHGAGADVTEPGLELVS